MKESARSSAEISVDIGIRNIIGSSASLKSVSTSKRRAGPAGIEVAFQSLLANRTPRPLGGQNFSLLLKKLPFSMSIQRKTMLQMRTMILSKVGTQT
jgi:hypothetical protein